MIEKRLPYNHIEWRKHVIKSTLSGLYSTLLYNGFTAYGTCKSSRILLSEVPYPVTISYGAFKALRLRLSLAGGGASSSCRVLSPHDHTYSSLYTRVRWINYSHGLPWHQNAPKISKGQPQNDLHFISILEWKNPAVMRWCFLAAYLPYLLVGPPSIYTGKPKSTNFGWNPGCLHKKGKHLWHAPVSSQLWGMLNPKPKSNPLYFWIVPYRKHSPILHYISIIWSIDVYTVQ